MKRYNVDTKLAIDWKEIFIFSTDREMIAKICK